MKLLVRVKGKPAGTLEKTEAGKYLFSYYDGFLAEPDTPPVSLTMPKKRTDYQSDYLFPCFFNILPEGYNKQLICRKHKIDEKDYFTLLKVVAERDTIGAITVHSYEQV